MILRTLQRRIVVVFVGLLLLVMGLIVGLVSGSNQRMVASETARELAVGTRIFQRLVEQNPLARPAFLTNPEGTIAVYEKLLDLLDQRDVERVRNDAFSKSIATWRPSSAPHVGAWRPRGRSAFTCAAISRQRSSSCTSKSRTERKSLRAGAAVLMA